MEAAVGALVRGAVAPTRRNEAGAVAGLVAAVEDDTLALLDGHASSVARQAIRTKRVVLARTGVDVGGMVGDVVGQPRLR